MPRTFNSIEEQFGFVRYQFQRLAGERAWALKMAGALWPQRNTPSTISKNHAYTRHAIRMWLLEARTSDTETALLRLGLSLEDLLPAFDQAGFPRLSPGDPHGFLAVLIGAARRAGPNDLEHFRMGSQSRFGKAPTDAEWTEPFDQAKRRRARIMNLSRWELVGDLAVAFYDLIAPRTLEQRRSPVARVRNTYNAEALGLAAKIVNLYLRFWLRRPLRATDVASRLQARGKTAPK